MNPNKLQQDKIASLLGLPPETIVFEDSIVNNIYQLGLHTINLVHKQKFLLQIIHGLSLDECYRIMIDYVENQLVNESSYTVQWSKKGEDQFNTSYFRGQNIYQILDKFFYDKDLALYEIYHIQINPMS